MELRPYQEQAIKQIQEAYKGGKKSVMLQLQTGLGKTMCFSTIGAKVVGKGNTAMVLVNRKELLKQAYDKFVDCGCKPSMIASGHVTHKSNIYIASVDTLRNRELPRVNLLIVDEAHIASFQKIVKYYKEQGSFILGCSATPLSTKKHNLSEMYDAMVSTIECEKAIEMGYLSDAITYGAETELGKISMKMGDFDTAQMYNAYDKPLMYKNCIEKFNKFCKDDITMVFCVNREHTIKTYEEFIAAGINATYVISGESDKVRDERVKDFKAGKYQVMVNCGILCLDEKTEILTDQGWTKIDEMSYDNKVANWDNGSIYFKEPKNIIKRERLPDEKMVIIKSMYKDVRVTDKHKMIWKSQRSKNWNKSSAVDLVNKRCQIPVSGLHEPEKIEMPLPFIYTKKEYNRAVATNSYILRKNNGHSKSDSVLIAKERLERKISLRYKAPHELSINECRFIGFWLGDGTKRGNIGENPRYCIGQALSNMQIIKWFDKVIKSTNFYHTRRVCESGRVPHVRWELARGTGHGNQSKDGVFCIEPYLEKDGCVYLKYFNKEQCDALIEGFWFADGDHGKFKKMPQSRCRIGNTNKPLLDKIQSLAICRGYRCTTTIGHKPRKPHHKQIYRLTFRKNVKEFYLSRNYLEVEEEKYKPERVWCVATDSGNIITRRNGHVTVMGNCTGYDQPSVSAIIINRATASLPLFLQMTGRGSRVIKGVKNKFKIIDLGNNVSRLGFWQQDRKWSLFPPEKKSDGLSIAPTKECPEPVAGVQIDLLSKSGCGATIHASTMVCPHCGYEFPKAEKTEKDDEFVELEYRRIKLERMVNSYKQKDWHKVPDDMLVEFGKAKGFHHGWAKNELSRRQSGKKIVTLKGYSGEDFFERLKEIQKYYKDDKKIPADRFVFASENDTHINFTWTGTEIKAVENAEEAGSLIH